MAEVNDAHEEKRKLLTEKIQLYKPTELTSNAEVEDLSKRYMDAEIVPEKYEG